MKKEEIKYFEWQVECPCLGGREKPVVIQSDDDEGNKVIGVYCVYGQVGECNGIPICRRLGLCQNQEVWGGMEYLC